MVACADLARIQDGRRVVYRQRIKLGISQEDFADQVGLDRTYISGIKRGIRNPTLLVRLARVLGVPAAAVLNSIGMESDT